MFIRNAVRTARRPDAEASVSLLKRRAWFDGEGTSAETTTTDTSAGATTEGSTASGGQVATLTQEQANKLIGEARKKGREAALAELLKELNLDKIDDLKGKVTSAKEREDAEKTEAQKAIDALKAEQTKRETLEKQLADVTTARLNDKRETVLRSAATKAGALDVEDVLLWANANGGDTLASIVKVDGDSVTLDEKAAEKLVQDAKKAKPHYFKAAGPGTPSLRGGQTSDPGKGEKERARNDMYRNTKSRF